MGKQTNKQRDRDREKHILGHVHSLYMYIPIYMYIPLQICTCVICRSIHKHTHGTHHTYTYMYKVNTYVPAHTLYLCTHI